MTTDSSHFSESSHNDCRPSHNNKPGHDFAVDILTDLPIPIQKRISRRDLAKNPVCLYAVDQRLYVLREVTR